MKKQMKRTGKFLALVLAGLMAFSSLELSTFAADDVSIQTVSKTVTAELEMPENEELLTGYLEQIFYGNYISTFAVGLNTAGSRLSGDEKLVYDALVPYMKQIAAGSRVSTVITLGHEVNNGVEICPVDTEITFTGTFDDFDLGSVNEALLSDYPYEMYWYDKTVGVTANGYESDAISQITFTFPVASDYQNGDSTTINAAYATAATTAVANADAIITENASNSDYDKLVAYSNKIMELVSYDTNAAQNNTFSSDIDPWQLINVFDGVDTTNVVCEGYSKAFQYLCDKTTFTGDVSCYSVTGTMDGGGHMWNIVTIEDANYLVDVTNSESGTVGQDGTLFLAGTTGSVAGGYTFTSTYDQSIQYIYYDDTIAFWGSDDDSILKLASESYEEEVVCVHEWTSYNADDTANTITAHCSTCEADYLTYTLQLPTENIYTGKVLETAKYVGSTNNIWNSTEPTITYTAKAGSSLTEGLAVNAGEYTVTMSWKGFSVSADYTIGKRSVTVTPKDQTIAVNETADATQITLGGEHNLAEGHNCTVTYAAVDTTSVGTKTLTIDTVTILDANSNDVTGNYNITKQTGTLNVKTHEHVWSYVANEENNTITATCSGSIGTCPVANNKVVITLVSPAGELVYDGTKKPVSVTQSPENVFTDLDDSDIVATNDCVSAGVHSVTLTYGGKSVSATFTIKQKESQYTAPDLLSAIYGNTLADVELPDNFTWQDALTTKVGNVGTNTFKATYTPDDVVNYTTVRDIEIPIKVSAKNITATVEVADGTYIYTGTAITPAVTVKDGSTVISETEYTVNYTDNINAGTATITVTAKNGGNYSFTEVAKTFDIAQADNPPGKPASTLSTSYTNKKIGDITLSTGWEWLEADKDTALEVGESKTATANYTAADKNNYKNLTVVVTVTREACSHSGGNATCTEKATCSVCGKEYGSYGSHGSTEERGVVAATCSANGYSGDSYCKDCGARVSYGYVTAKLQHIYVTVVTKAPTCEETGIQTHTCSNCGDVLTETLLQKGHDYKSEITVEPTVEKEGVRTYTCKVCGHIYTKSIAKLEPEPEKTEPFIKGNNGKEGWDAISKELDDSKKDDIYIIDMNNGSTVPGEVIETVKGKEVIVVFDLGNDITWRVNGKNIAADKIDNIDFGIKVETPDEPLNNIPEDVLKKVKGDRESVDINLAYEGEFGFKAVLSINMGAENAGKYANLFYYNPATKSLDFVCADDVSVDGTATLTFDHASDYTIILDTTSMYNVSTEKEPVDGDKEDEGTVSTETKENEESKPAGDKEADSSSVNELEKNGGGIVWFLVIGGVLLLVIIGVVLVVRKRNNDDF